MGNSNLHQDARDTVIFASWGDAKRDAFAAPVDVTFHNRDGSWETNLAFLRENFGITLEVVEDTITIREVELVELQSPAGVSQGD